VFGVLFSAGRTEARGESMWTRLRRPKQIATTVLALAGVVLLTLSMLAGNS